MKTHTMDIPYMRPTIPDPSLIAQDIEKILASGILTKGPVVRRYEEALAERLGVRNVVATANCTIGLVLLFKALNLNGPVITPSYTFMATVHALRWVGAEPIFADIDPNTWTLDPASVEDRLTEETQAIVGVPVFGAPCDTAKLQELADAAGIPLLFDSAHGVGSSCGGNPLGGNGTAEAFSTSPTKALVSAEGGFVTTNDDELARTLRTLIEYGNDGSLDSVLVGLNGRLSEVHAAIGLRCLEALNPTLAERSELVAQYREALESVAGITFQDIPPGCVSSYKDLTILITDDFGCSRDEVARSLLKSGIHTKKYFDPPVHRQQAYRSEAQMPNLPVTDRVAGRALSLPLGSGLAKNAVSYVSDALAGLRR